MDDYSNTNETEQGAITFDEKIGDLSSWLTESATGHFFPLSFKFGICIGIQLAVIYNQRGSLFRNGFVGKIPFLLQVSWFINVILWNLGFFTMDEMVIFWLPVCSNFFDLITKFLIIYFVCFRMIIMKDLQNNLYTILWRVLIVTGFILSILGDIPEFIKLVITEETYNFLNLFYPITDAYISVIEIISLVAFIIVKYGLYKNMSGIWLVILEHDLIVDCVVIVFSCFISFTLMIMKLSMEYDIDYDLNFVNIVATLKYASSCNAVIAVFKKTKDSIRTNYSRAQSLQSPHSQLNFEVTKQVASIKPENNTPKDVNLKVSASKQ